MNRTIIICAAMAGIAFFPASHGADTAVIQKRFVCGETVACGKSVRVNGDHVTLDRKIIREIAKNPSPKALRGRLWEFVYFLSIGDKEAMSVAIDLLAQVDPDDVQLRDHDGVRPVARTLTNTSHFWDVLATKPLSVRRKVIQYFDVNKRDYTLGYDYEEEKKKMLSTDKK